MSFLYFLGGALLGAMIVVLCWIHAVNADLELIEKCSLDDIALQDEKLCQMYDVYLEENENGNA